MFVNSSKMSWEGFSKPNKVVLGDTIQIPIGIVITSANLLSFVALYRCSRLSFQIRILAINLCVSDILIGVSMVLPARIYYINNCLYKKYIASAFLVVSSLTITMINLDRCLAIHYGIRYYTYMSKKVLTSICVAFWVLSMVLSYLMYFNPNSEFGVSCQPIMYVPKNSVTIAVSVFLVLNIASNVVMFTYLVRAVRKSLHVYHYRYGHVTDKYRDQQTIVIQKLVVITGCFIACSLPYMITTFPILGSDIPSRKQAHIVTSIIFTMNSAINPFLYVWRLQETRYQMKRLLCFWNRSYTEKLEQRNKADTATYCINVIDSS